MIYALIGYLTVFSGCKFFVYSHDNQVLATALHIIFSFDNDNLSKPGDLVGKMLTKNNSILNYSTIYFKFYSTFKFVNMFGTNNI